MTGAAFIALSFMQQAMTIRANSDVVEKILNQVRQIRLERGLDVDDMEV